MRCKKNLFGTKRFRNKLVLTIFAATLMPILVMIAYIAVLMGPRLWYYLDSQNINQDIWQLKKWNYEDAAFRYLNHIVLEDPELLFDESTFLPLEDNKPIRDIELIILIKKGDDVRVVNDLSTTEGIKVTSKFRNIEGNILPDFKSYEQTHNEVLFDKTGYIVFRQLDFYFDDDEEGSIYFLTKVVNVPSNIGRFVANYFLILFVIMMIFLLSFLFHGSVNLAKNFEYLAQFVDEVSRENFNARLNISSEPLSFISDKLNEMNEKLAKAKMYREEVERSRAEFISSMTHDLKTPLTAIRVQLEALSDGIVTNPENYFISMQKKLSDIDYMMNELQVFNDLESENLEFDYKRVDLRYFLEDIIEEWKYEAREGSVNINYICNENQPVFCMIDPAKLRRVTANIFSNSIKYANQKDLCVDISIEIENETAYLKFIDNGHGVPEHEIDNIFKQYYRVDPSRNQQISGSGLGLAICKSIITRHNGNIKAFSNGDKGFGIVIALPISGGADETNFADRG